MVASPSRLVIPAGGSYRPRLIFLGERSEERYFRVRFIPVLPTRTQGFDLSDDEIKRYDEKLAAEMSVLAGYGVWVSVAPKAGYFDTAVEETPDAYVVYNKGNATVELSNILECAEECVAPIKKILFPSRTYSLEKKAGTRYQFKLREGGKEKVMRLGS